MKTAEECQDVTRREFLRNMLRWTAALALGGGLGAALQGQRKICEAQNCSSCPEGSFCAQHLRQEKETEGTK